MSAADEKKAKAKARAYHEQRKVYFRFLDHLIPILHKDGRYPGVAARREADRAFYAQQNAR